MKIKNLLLMLILLIPIMGYTGGAEFNGTTSFIQITQQAAINTQVFTVGCFARHESDGGGGLGRIAEKALAWSYRKNANDTYRLTGLGWSGTDGVWEWPGAAVNTWHHTAVSYDGSLIANDAVGYLNGVAQTTTRATSPTGTFAAGTGDLFLGNDTVATRTWDGQLAECFYYDRILSAGEVMQIVNRGPASRGMAIGYWPLGVFGARNYTATTGLTGTPTAITVSTVPLPLRYASQGEAP